VGLLLALHSILVGEGNLAEEHILVAVEGNPVEEHILVEAEDNLAEDTPVEILVVVDTLEEASAAVQSQILAVHADQDLSHALLLIAVREVVLLLVVRMVVPGCSYVSPL